MTTSQDRRLKQQLATIARATSAADRQPDQRLEFSIPHMAHASELNALVQEARVGRFTYRQVGPGLLLVAYGERRRSLSSILLGEGGSIPQGALSDLPEKAISLVLRGSPYNCILVNSPFHSGPWEPVLMPGTTPFFWWPLDVSVLRAMALGRRIVTSVYNPAHLFAEVVRRGFTVERFKPPDDFALALSDGTRKLTVENVIYFLHLVSVSLLSEEYVVDVISRIATQTYRRGDRSVRVNLQFVHDMLGGGSRKQRASGERMPGAVMLSERRAGR
jgi:hypothetical protein